MEEKVEVEEKEEDDEIEIEEKVEEEEEKDVNNMSVKELKALIRSARLKVERLPREERTQRES